MKSESLPNLKPLWLIALAMVLGTFIVVTVPISIAGGDNIKSSDWIGFSGSIVAGVVTLFAAVLAWFAVQRQITALEDAEKSAAARLAEQRDADMSNAKEAAKIVLAHRVHAAAAVMNVTCQYLDAVARQPTLGIGGIGYAGDGQQEAQRIKPMLVTAMAQLKASMSHFAVAEAWKDLETEDKRTYLLVTATLHTISNIFDNQPPITFNEMIGNQRETLTDFSTYLRALDGELADIYERDSKA